MINLIEWVGTFFGFVGATALATNKRRFARLGWASLLIANVAMIALAVQIERHGFLLQQSGFFFSSLVGFYRSGH